MARDQEARAGRGRPLAADEGPMSSHANTRPPTDVSTTTLPARFYTDPAWFERELDCVHYRMWLYAGRAECIPSAGDYFVVNVGAASVIVVRDETGDVRAFHNVCRHRGTLLCSEREGHLPGRLRCPYHAWTYRLDGTLAHAPHMDLVRGFDEAQYPLRAVHVAAWAGNVFLNLAERPAPFAEHLAGLDAKFRHWNMDEMRVVARRTYDLAANWKLVIQNYHECLHCPTAHPELNRRSHYMSGANEPAQPSYLGARMDLRDGFATLSTSEHPRRAPLPDLDEVERRSVYYYALLPNLLLNLHPDYVVSFRLNPRSVDATEIVCEWMFSPRDIDATGFDPSDAIDFWDLTNRQDWELSALAQAGIRTMGYRQGPYSNREELLVAFDRWVLERSEKLA
jgi:Rieske 2Fe-2S family protein